jgi:tetratricopeptide (TPR) repeat protein
MRPRDLAVFLSALALSSSAREVHAAPPSQETTTPPSGITAAHLKRAEQARQGKRWAEAIEAYNAALVEAQRAGMPAKETAVILGELGVCEVALQRYRDAAEHLEQSLKNGWALSRSQAARFQTAQRKAEAEVSTVFISTDPSDAEIFVDGKSIGAGQPSYLIFVEPGSHTVRAHLFGHSDAMQTVEPGRGQRVGISMRLSPPMLVPIASTNRPLPAIPPTVTTFAPTESDTRGAPLFRGLETMALGTGVIPLVAFGVSPGTGVGVSVDVIYRNGNLSLNGEVRIMGSQVIQAGAEDGVRTIRGGTNISACGHVSLAFLCGVAGWSIIDGMPGTYIKMVDTDEPVSGIFGVRSGLDWRFHDRLALRMFGELLYTMGQPSVWVNHVRLWAAPPVAGILGLGFVLPMGDYPQGKATALHRANVASLPGL